MAPLQSTTAPRDSGLNSDAENPFSTIESAQEFVKLLMKAVRDAKRELDASVEGESGSDESRRLDAFRVALYSLSKLETHMHQSSRILNDLRTLRRLLLAERNVKSVIMSANVTEMDEGAPAEIDAASLDRPPL